MARRSENECAYCAEEIEPESAVIGGDWKVYCSQACVELGEPISAREWQQLMRVAIPSRDALPVPPPS